MIEHSRADIIGQTIKSIHATKERQGDLDIARTYYTLHSGVCFFMPLACSPFVAADPPGDAEQLSGPLIKRCLASPIARVLAVQDEDGFIDPDSLVIQLSSGDCLLDNWFAPHGTELSGLRVYRAGDIDLSRHQDYWTLDRAADEASWCSDSSFDIPPQS